jgi:methionine-gamma-lyase
MTVRAYGCPHDAAAPAGPLSPDLTRSTTFAYASAEELRAVGTGEREGEFYPRYGHPNGREFESRVAALEGADGAVAFASGLAAMHGVFFGLLRSGDAIAISRYVYGGVEAMAAADLPRFGIEVRRFDPFDAASMSQAFNGAKLVHIETPTNPLCRVLPVRQIAESCRRAGASLSVDATFLPPPFQRPMEEGADLVVHSATKILGGHSDTHAGVVSGPHELLERIEGFRRRSGAVLAPDTAWLLVRSLATLELRTRAASQNAATLARFLAGHPQVERVHYESVGFMLSFEVRGGLAAAVRVYDRFELIARAVSLGGVETLASLPLHTSHAMMSADELRSAGIAEGLVRLSVGIEPVEKLQADLSQALG